MLENSFYESSSPKPVIEGTGVNVIYFTNQCNLACTYCYEDLSGRPRQILTREQIKDSVDIILDREPEDQQTLFVLFGGEVTLEWSNAEYMMEYAYSKKKNVHFNISTNGVMFRKDWFIVQYTNLKYNKLGLTSLDISFDGVGNQERVTHNGKQSTPILMDVFRKLHLYSVPFRLRYTIHAENIGSLREDLKNIIQYISPERVITSVAWDTLNDQQLGLLKSEKELLRNDWLSNMINTPVCQMFCDVCNGCTMQKDIKTYFTDEGNVTTYKNKESTPKFNDFKEKEND